MDMMRLVTCLSLIFLLAAGTATAKRAKPKPKPAAASISNELAMDLYQQLAKQDGDFVFSPASISLAFAMTWAGAHGDTASQMAKVLHFDSLADAHASHAGLLKLLAAADKSKGVELAVANKIWAHRGYPFAKQFLDLTAAQYGAKLELVDFKLKYEPTRKLINAWVMKQTRKRIADLLPDGSLDEETRMVLVNAIYFKGAWAKKFDKQLTADGAFTLADGKTVDVPLMNQSGTFKFAHRDEVSLIELPYRDSDLTMVLILPDDVAGLPAVEKKLSANTLAGWIGSMVEREDVELTIPRFETTFELKLAKTLADLGMKLPFDQDKSDFSGMLTKDAVDAGERLFISGAFHKAFLAVNEEGAEAAAATAVVMARPTSVQQNPVFRADHPFIYMIRDAKTGTILFMGRLADPRS